MDSIKIFFACCVCGKRSLIIFYIGMDKENLLHFNNVKVFIIRISVSFFHFSSKFFHIAKEAWFEYYFIRRDKEINSIWNFWRISKCIMIPNFSIVVCVILYILQVIYLKRYTFTFDNSWEETITSNYIILKITRYLKIRIFIDIMMKD